MLDVKIEAAREIDGVTAREAELGAKRQIRRRAPKAKVLILTGYMEDEQILAALRAGASGYVVKKSDVQELLLGIWEADRKTVLFVTHDIDEAIFMANRVAVMTARPGRIKSDIAIDLPHPRHYTIKTSPEFSAYKARLTEEIRVESIRAAEMGA